MPKETFQQTLSKIKGQVEGVIGQIILRGVDNKFRDPVLYPFAAGGKRIRAILAVLCCKMLGGKNKDIIFPAAGLEIFHNYTLIVDDIIDHGLLRRNKPTTNVKYGASFANLISMDYAAAIFESACGLSCSKSVIKVFANTMKQVTEGQFLDVLFERAGRDEEKYIVQERYKEITQADYLEMVGKKTASLFAAACVLGGICAKAGPEKINALRKFGFNLGIAFQIQDDILDIFGKEEKFGKKIGKDIKERKGGNIVILLAQEDLLQRLKRMLQRIMAKSEITVKDKKIVISIIAATKAKESAEAIQNEYLTKAIRCLGSLPKNKYRESLKWLADSIVQREN